MDTSAKTSEVTIVSEYEPLESRSTRALALVVQGVTLTEAARQLGISPQAVHIAWRRKYPNIPPPQRQCALERKAAVLSFIGPDIDLKGKNLCSLSAKEIVERTNPSLELTEALVRSIAAANNVKLAPQGRATDYASAFSALRKGASITEAAILAGVSPGTLSRVASKSKVQANREHAPVRDGRTLRAIVRVLLDGQTVTEACLEEICAQPGVRNGLNHGSTALRLCRFLGTCPDSQADLSKLCYFTSLDGTRMERILQTMGDLLLVSRTSSNEWKLNEKGHLLRIAWENYQNNRTVASERGR